MRTIAIITLLCLSISVNAGDFQNWYFEFLSVPCKIAGRILSPDSHESGTFSGTSTGKISPDGTRFTESFQYVYLPGNHPFKDALGWRKRNDGVFTTSGINTVGDRFSIELTITIDKQYKQKTTFADGRMVETAARLESDNVIYATDTARTKTAAVAFIIKSTRTKAKEKPDAPKGEQAGADQPATEPADKSPAKDQPSPPTPKVVPR